MNMLSMSHKANRFIGKQVTSMIVHVCYITVSGSGDEADACTPPYKCRLCTFSSSSYNNLQMHTTKHGGKIPTVESLLTGLLLYLNLLHIEHGMLSQIYLILYSHL